MITLVILLIRSRKNIILITAYSNTGFVTLSLHNRPYRFYTIQAPKNTIPFTELQRKRRWQSGSLHYNHGRRTQHVPEVSAREEDPQEPAGEVRGTRRLHEHGVPGRDQGPDEERADPGAAAVH